MPQGEMMLFPPSNGGRTVPSARTTSAIDPKRTLACLVNLTMRFPCLRTPKLAPAQICPLDLGEGYGRPSCSKAVRSGALEILISPL